MRRCCEITWRRRRTKRSRRSSSRRRSRQAPAKKLEASDASPATYIGSEACVKCHRDQVGTFGQTLHGQIFLKHPRSDDEKLGCEALSWPGLEARQDQGNRRRSARRHHRLRQGRAAAGRRAQRDLPGLSRTRRPHLLEGQRPRDAGLACTSCHQLMEKVSPKNQMIKSTEVEVCFQCHKDRRAQFERPSHHPLREGDMTCSSCHNPHGSATDSLLRGASINETCYKCHADKRGPFLWETRARSRELPELSRTARHGERVPAQGAAAAPLPALPRGRPRPRQSGQSDGRPGAQPVMPELPHGSARLQFAGWQSLPEVTRSTE